MTDDETRTEQAPLTLSSALAALRERAAAAPGEWKEAEGSELILEWIASPPELGTPEAVRITRRHVTPVARDLEQVAAALPRSVEIGPIRMTPRARQLTLGLRPRSGRPVAERCSLCNASPRYGTHLFGDAQLCSPCSLYGSARDGLDDRGSALIGVLIVILLLGLLVGGALMNLEAAERTRGARAGSSVLDAAAAGEIASMTERLRSRSALRLGALDDADIAALNAAISPLPAPPDATLDLANTGYRVVAVREQVPMPDDALLTDLWTDQPRVRFDAMPRPQGQTLSRIVEIEMRVRVTLPTGAQRTFTRTAAVARLSPFPYAVYRSGTGEFCATATGATITGAVRVDGAANFLSCAGAVSLFGSLEARDGVRNDDPRNGIVSEDGFRPFNAWTRDAAETAATGLLSASLGHVRFPAATGGTFEASRRQDASLAGTGECADRTGACGGAGYYAPSISVQRTSLGAAPGWAVACGPAYGSGSGCIPAVAGAMRYHPWPWNGPVPSGVALPDPSDPSRLWRGLLFDPRREARCTATVAGATYATHRCPSTVYGWVLDLGTLPPVTGGMLYVRAASVDPPGRAAAGAQEALVIRNGTRVAAPLTIISDVPVYVMGSLNTEASAAWRGPPPVMIDAPRIALLPAEADSELGLAASAPGWASVWDVVAPQGEVTPSALPIVAASNATLSAVLRTEVCGRPEGVYQGGVMDQAPAVVGDWSGAEVRVVGAVEQKEVAGLSAAVCRWWGAGAGAAADGSPWAMPARRTLLYDPRLLHPGFVVPGSFLPANISAGGVAGAADRSATRQARATGGYGMMWITEGTGQRAPRPGTTASPPGSLPPPPPALMR